MHEATREGWEEEEEAIARVRPKPPAPPSPHFLHLFFFPLSFLQKTLGVFLVWRSPSDNVEVTADVAFTLLNREDFAESRAFQVQRASFRYFSFLFLFVSHPGNTI